MKTQFGFNYVHCTSDTLVKSGAGVLHSVVINKLATTAGVVTLCDAITEVAPAIAAITISTVAAPYQNPVTLLYDIKFTTGLYAGFDGTIAGADITISYLQMYNWERRDQKLRARKSIMRKHGKGIAQQYKQAILNRQGAKKFGSKI